MTQVVSQKFDVFVQDKIAAEPGSQHTKCIVTGGAGFIGSFIAERLLQLGYTVTVIDDLSTGKASNVPDGADLIELSLGEHSKYHNSAVIDACLKDTSYVFHAAANPQISEGLENPLRTHVQNVDGTVQLLDRIRRLEKMPKVILSSSAAVYGNGNGADKIKETDKINPGTPYAVQKYAQELYVKTFHDTWHVPSVILRYFNVYGSKRQSDSGAYPNVLASFLRSKQKTGRLWITGDGTQSRDFVFISDVVDANIAAMESHFENCEVFNIGTGNAISINEVARHFNAPIDYKPERPGDVKMSCADVSKAALLLKWSAQVPFERGIERYLNEK